MSESSWVVDVTADNFHEDVILRSESVPVVVDFWAEWCGPCRLLGPLLERLIDERAGQVVLAKVDIDRSPAMAGQFGIQSVPTVVAFQGGAPVLSFTGALPEPELRRFLDQLAPAVEAPEGPLAALAGASPEEAEAGYRALLAEEPAHEAASVGLAGLLLDRGELDEARALLERVAPGGEQADAITRLQGRLTLHDLAAGQPDAASLRTQVEAAPSPAGRYALGCALARDGRYADALAELLAAGEADKQLAREQVRPAMVAVFSVIGHGDPLAKDYRGKLALLLF